MKRFFISGYNYIQDIVLEAGTYTFWAYIKSDFGNTFTFALANAANEWEVFDVDVQQGQWTKAYEVFTIKEKKVKLSLIYRYFDAEHPVYVLKPQLIKGNIPSDAGASPFDIDKVTDDLHDAIGSIEDFTNDEFADRVLSSGERVSLRRDLESVEVIFQSLKGSYEKLLINPFVNALVLADLTAKYNAVSSAKDNLFTTLNTIIAGDNIVTPEEIAAKDLALSSLNNALYAYNTAEKEIANALGEDYTQKIGAIRDFTDTEFADRMLSETERVSLRHDLDNVQTLLDEITASYDEIVLNPYLTVADITLLTDKYNALFDAWDWDYDIDPSKPDGLKTVILDIINGDEIVTQAEIDEKDLALANFNNKLGEYSTVEVQMSKFAIDHAIEQAASWSINATSPVIYKDAKDAITDGVHTQVTVKGQLHRGTDIQDGGFITITPNGETEPATAVSSPITISPSDNADKSSYTVRLYDTASKTTLLDTLTIPVVFKGASGVNAINVVLSNEADVLPASPEGVVSDYSGSGTTIRVFEGATELDYDGIGSANGKFNVTATSTGITVGTKSENGLMCVFGNASNMTLDNAFITFTISGKTQAGASFSVTKTQSFAKARTGQKGDQGLQGIPGVPGADGVTYYTWIRYADTPTSGMSQYPDGKPYIGLAYNKTTPTESSVYADYKWSLIMGEQGIPGQKGADGIQYYTWIKYADSPTSGMSDDPTGKAYIGIAVNKTTATESTNYADYTWQLTKGEKGDTGASAPLLYLSASSHVMKCNPDNTPQTGQTITFEAKLQNVTGTATFTATPYNDAGVAQTPITLGGSGNIRTLTDSQWLAAYKRVEVVATLGSLTDKVTIYRVADGASGRGISSTVVTYQVGSSGTTAPTGTWLSTIPTVPEGQYLWTRTVTTYTDSTTSTSYSVSRQAPTGAAGRGIISTVITYQSSASGTVIPDGTWSSTIPYVAENEYLWTRTVITYTDSTTSTSYSVGKMGAKGTDAIVGFLTNESVTLQANSSGVVSSFASANGEFWVYNGTTKVTSGITFSKVSETGCTAAITSAGAYSVSAMSADNATVVLRAVYGGVTIDKVLTLSKSRAGADGVSITLVDVEFAKNTSPTTAPTTGWTTTAPTLAEGEQLWTRTKTTYSSGSPTYTTPANITPKKGDVGTGVESVTEEYAISTSKTVQPTTGWSTTQPAWVQGQYIWSRVKVVYKNPTSTVYTGYAVSSEWEAINDIEIGGRNLFQIGKLGKILGGLWSADTSALTVDGYKVTINSNPKDIFAVTFNTTNSVIAISGKTNLPMIMAFVNAYDSNGVRIGGESIKTMSLSNGKFELVHPLPSNTVRVDLGLGYHPFSTYGSYFVEDVMVVNGNKIMDFQPAPEDVQAEINQAKQEALDASNNVQTNVDSLNTYVDGAFKDGVIDAAEAKAIEKYKNSINESMAKAEASYNKVYANTYLEGAAKTALLNAKINLWGQRDTLISSINTAIAGGQTTPAQKTAVDNAFNTFNSLMSAFQSALEEANKAIQAKLDSLSTEKVNNMEIGGRNLILNSQARAEVTNGPNQNWIAPPYYLSEPLKIGQKYTFYCEGIEGTSINRLSFRDPASEFYGVTGNKLTFTATAESTYLYLYLSDYSATYKIGGIKLVKGDKCDDWTPAPEDVQAEIDAAVVRATYWSIKSSASVIYKKAPDETTSGTHTSVTVSGELRSGTTTTQGGFITVTPNDGTEPSTATASPVTISPSIGDGKTSYTVRLYDTASKTTLLDTLTIPVVFKGASGVNAINVVLSNEADVLPASPEGVVSDYSGSGTEIRVFEGATELSYGTGNGQYQVSAVGSGITVGTPSTSGNRRVYGVASNMTSDNATITFTITGKTASGTSFSLTKTQSFAKSRTGQKGDTGASAPLLYLSASAQVMKCNPGNTPQTGQTISIEAKLQNVSGTATFVATPYNDAGEAQTPVTLGGTGNTRTLTNAQWLATYKRIEVVATLGSLTDKVTIHRVADGATGKGISGTEIKYQVGTSGTTAPTGTWLTSVPTVPEGQFLWTRTITSYTDSTSTTSYSVSKQGVSGSDGIGISSTVITYQASSSGTVVPTGTWSGTIPSVSENQFLWTRTVITYTDSTTSTSYS
ncbi:MAG TPA: hypothetical protein PLN36_09410, partial [Bacteroidales bacterium]|nr:hypothetical protein [Bacteroidales bacterium]